MQTIHEHIQNCIPQAVNLELVDTTEHLPKRGFQFSYALSRSAASNVPMPCTCDKEQIKRSIGRKKNATSAQVQLSAYQICSKIDK